MQELSVEVQKQKLEQTENDRKNTEEKLAMTDEKLKGI